MTTPSTKMKRQATAHQRWRSHSSNQPAPPFGLYSASSSPRLPARKASLMALPLQAKAPSHQTPTSSASQRRSRHATTSSSTQPKRGSAQWRPSLQKSSRGGTEKNASSSWYLALADKFSETAGTWHKDNIGSLMTFITFSDNIDKKSDGPTHPSLPISPESHHLTDSISRVASKTLLPFSTQLNTILWALPLATFLRVLVT